MHAKTTRQGTGAWNSTYNYIAGALLTLYYRYTARAGPIELRYNVAYMQAYIILYLR